MAYESDNTIILEVLTVASTTVLGETKPLKIAAPCSFSNAKGNLREVDSFEQVSTAAESSAANFMSAFAQPTA